MRRPLPEDLLRAGEDRDLGRGRAPAPADPDQRLRGGAPAQEGVPRGARDTEPVPHGAGPARGEAIVAVVGVANKQADYTEQDALQLGLLMDGVWKNLDRARAERALRESEARLAESQRVARIGHYDYDIVADRWQSSADARRAVRHRRGLRPRRAGWLQVIHPEERERMRAYLADEVLGPAARSTGSTACSASRTARCAGCTVSGGSSATSGGGRSGCSARSRTSPSAAAPRSSACDLEQQVLHAQKLESLGVLAGGIAHDFNNILMAVLGNAELARLRVAPESAGGGEPAPDRAGARAGPRTSPARCWPTPARGGSSSSRTDLNQLVEEMEQMLRVSISKKALLRLKLAHALPAVDADATQLRQIVMNLVINASEAIGEKSGVIAVSTGCRRCARDYLRELLARRGAARGALRHPRGRRHRLRHGRRDPRADLRPLLHHEVHRARPRHGRRARDRARAQGGDHGLQRGREGHHLHGLPPGERQRAGAARRSRGGAALARAGPRAARRRRGERARGRRGDAARAGLRGRDGGGRARGAGALPASGGRTSWSST